MQIYDAFNGRVSFGGSEFTLVFKHIFDILPSLSADKSGSDGLASPGSSPTVRVASRANDRVGVGILVVGYLFKCYLSQYG